MSEKLVFYRASWVGPDRWSDCGMSLLTTDLCIHKATDSALPWDQEPIIAGPFESVEAGKAALVLIASSGGG